MYLQFRPTTGPTGTGSPTANPACDPNGLVVASFPFTNDPADTQIAGTPSNGYFIGQNRYNVCVYLVNPQVASGTIESTVSDGTTADLPTNLAGRYRINMSGAYASLHNIADAEYTSTDGWVTQQQGYNVDPWFLGEGFGDVQVNGQLRGLGRFQCVARVQPLHDALWFREPRRLRR